MNDVLLKSYLKSLRLPTMAREHQAAARQITEENGTCLDYLQLLAEWEVNERSQKAAVRRLKEARFPVERDLSDFDFSAVPSLPRQTILELARGDYIEKRECVVFLGPPGVGKTHLAIALGREACRKGSRVAFFTASGLATLYAEAREERELRTLQRTIQRRNLIIIDELGYVPLTQGAAQNLFDFFSMCYEQTSILVTTNLPFAQWPEVFGDERLTGALLDRLTHRMHAFAIDGDSYRLKENQRRKEATCQ